MTAETFDAGELRKDRFLSWWLFGLVAGALSSVSLVESVSAGRPLILPLQWLMDRIGEGLESFGRLMEPFVLSLVQTGGGFFDLELTLQPHWRPLFFLALVLIIVLAAQFWRNSRPVSAIVSFFLAVVFGLLGAIVAAVQPSEPTPTLYSLFTSLSFLLLCIAFGLAMMRHEISSLDRHNPITVLFTCLFAFVVLPFFIALYFWKASWAEPGREVAAGVSALGLLVLIFALIFGGVGLVSRNRADARVALILLGPFIGAELIYVFDWVVWTFL